MSISVDELTGFLAGRDAAMISIETTYKPDLDGSKVYPPTYLRDESYVIEDRMMAGEKRSTVLLDSVPSQANRAEEGLEHARTSGRVALPTFILESKVDADRTVKLPSLEWPHRYADAYGRDSLLDGVAFDKSALGKRLRLATPEDVSALYERSPESLVYGAWDSHRPGHQAKFPRVYRSETFGLDPVRGARDAGRMDPLNLQGQAIPDGDGWSYKEPGEKAKGGTRLSELGHGNIAPQESHGGVTITEGRRVASVSLAALRRLRFGAASEEAMVAARTALAALALLGDRLAFDVPSVWLRSGCELLQISETVLLYTRGGEVQSLTISVEDAIELFESSVHRAADAGISMASDAITLQPTEALAKAIRYTFLKADSDD